MENLRSRQVSAVKSLILRMLLVPSHGRGRRFNPYSAHHWVSGTGDHVDSALASVRLRSDVARRWRVYAKFSRRGIRCVEYTEGDGGDVQSRLQLGLEGIIHKLVGTQATA